MHTRFERFSYSISQISYYWHKIAGEEMAVYGLKATCALYLLSMLQNEDGITASGLCEQSGRDKADVSRAVSAMEKKGLLIRERSGNNLYRAVLRLTAEGKTAAEQVRERAGLAVEIAGGDLTDQQRTVFYDALERIAENLQTMSQNGLPKE